MREAEQGLILLCCSLGEAVQPLSPAEYAQLWAALEQTHPEEPDGELTEEFLRSMGFSGALSRRVSYLLSRPGQLEAYLKGATDVTVLTRVSQGFPKRLRRLGRECPPVLFCKGDISLLEGPCVSLVGSRRLLERGYRFAQRIGRLAAREGFVLVSGNAYGADRAAQDACLKAGGRVISFVPDKLSSYPLSKNLLYLSDEGYDCAFSGKRALRRNHYIHALSERTFVAQCPEKQGGTWSGTVDNLRRGLSHVYVLADGSEGAMALRQLGAFFVDDGIDAIAALRPRQLSIFD